MTTNRIETFDPAFQSRIHISLRYDPLPFKSRREIWLAILRRAGVNEDSLTPIEVDTLAMGNKNGREIRNIVRTAEAVASSKEEPLDYSHLSQVKAITDTFDRRYGPLPLEIRGVTVDPFIQRIWTSAFAIDSDKGHSRGCYSWNNPVPALSTTNVVPNAIVPLLLFLLFPAIRESCGPLISRLWFALLLCRSLFNTIAFFSCDAHGRVRHELLIDLRILVITAIVSEMR